VFDVVISIIPFSCCTILDIFSNIENFYISFHITFLVQILVIVKHERTQGMSM
jgi:hypothetical protein